MAIKKTFLAIDFGSNSVKGIYYRIKNSKVYIKDSFEIKVPNGLYEDGEIKGFDDMVELLKPKMKAYKKTRALISIESSKLIKREMLCPYIENDMQSFLTMEVESHLPIDLEFYDLQFKFLDKVQSSDASEMINVIACAVPKEIVKSHYKLISALGLRAQVMDIQSNILGRLISDKNLKTHSMMVNIGHKITDISFYENGIYRFNRVIPFGGNLINELTMKYLNLDLEGAKHRKKNFKLHYMKDAYSELWDDSDDRARLVVDIIDNFEELFLEIQKIMRFYSSKNQQVAIENMFFLGGGTLHHQFLQLAGQYFETPIQMLEFDEGCFVGLEKIEGNLILFSTVLALALKNNEL